jgi:hypothetical protein
MPVRLESAARAFAEATALPPYLFDLGPEQGREVIDKVQGGTVDKHPVDITDLIVPAGAGPSQGAPVPG